MVSDGGNRDGWVREAVSHLRGGFWPALISAAFTAGIMYEAQRSHDTILEAALRAMREANAAEHAAIGRVNDLQEARINRVQMAADEARNDAAELRGKVEELERLVFDGRRK